MSRYHILSLITATCLAACSDESDPRCPQTYEFGNYGCADVAGRLLGAQDQPLGGIDYTIVNRDREAGDRFNTNVLPVSPESDGSFRLRVTRYLLTGPPTNPDTGSVWIVGSKRPSLGSAPALRDSLLVTLQFAPIGGVPEPAEILLRLPVP